MDGKGALPFLLAVSAAAAAAACLTAVFCRLLEPGLYMALPWLVPLARLLAALFMAYLLGGCAALWISRYTPYEKGPAWRAGLTSYLRRLFPFIKIGGQFLRREGRLSRAYISFINYLTLRERLSLRPEEVLILAPHCLQWDQCPHKITRTIENCRRCGRCPVGAIAALARREGSSFAVATGGTLARQIAAQARPKAIIAIACERDLISGMADVAPMPVVGLLNKRPFGPCFNTDVDVGALGRVLHQLTGERNERT